MNDTVIELNGLGRNFGELIAVKDVSFNVQRAAIFGLLGPNGSGKSTIIRMLLGKLVPYASVGFIEMLIVLVVMIYVFGVPVRGDIIALVALSMLFMICSLGLGLLVSTLARTQVEAMQFAFVIMLPSVLLSGFVFPRAEMPLPIYLATFAIPVTYYIEILRGIVLRGAEVQDLMPMIQGLVLCTIAVLGVSIARFRKQLE